MAYLTRYFSTSAAGAGDGTSWANRAALVDGSGLWSSVIEANDFQGGNPMTAFVGPGTYAINESMTGAFFDNTSPNVRNPLTFAACDSSGNPLTPPDPDWTSPEPAWDDSSLPVFNTGSTALRFSSTGLNFRLIKFTITANATWSTTSTIHYEWCSFAISGSGGSSQVLADGGYFHNCLVTFTSSQFLNAFTVNALNAVINCRISQSGASSGSRIAFGRTTGGVSGKIALCTIIGFTGGGIVLSTTNTSQTLNLYRNTIVNCGSHGVQLSSTASVSRSTMERNYVANNGGYGIDIQGNYAWVTNNRMRDNTSGNFNSSSNYGDYGSYTTDASDADEFVDAGAGDYRIKYGCAIHGRNYGAGEALAA